MTTVALRPSCGELMAWLAHGSWRQSHAVLNLHLEGLKAPLNSMYVPVIKHGPNVRVYRGRGWEDGEDGQWSVALHHACLPATSPPEPFATEAQHRTARRL
jgi:hypothetical protein